MDKIIRRNLSGRYRHKFLDYAKQSVTAAFKADSEISNQKTAETTSELIGSKIANKITSTVSRIIKRLLIKKQKINRNAKWKIYISEKRHRIFNQLRLIWYIKMDHQKNGISIKNR